MDILFALPEYAWKINITLRIVGVVTLYLFFAFFLCSLIDFIFLLRHFGEENFLSYL